MSQENTLLALSGVSKHFGGTQALDSIDIRFEPGKVHALIGENGAGKSTMGKIMLGVHAPDSGAVYLKGQKVSLRSPAEGNALGLVGIAQELSLLQSRSVADNISLGQEITRAGFVDAGATRASVLATMQEFDMPLDPDILVGDLPVAQQQKVEILRALGREAKLIVFDEPTARLASHEAKQLLGLVRRLAASGKAIVYISHFLDEVLEISDTITILRNGALVRSGAADLETRDTLVTGVTGRDLAHQFPPMVPPKTLDAPVLSVHSISRKDAFADISFSIHPGEIVGLAGLVGAGRSEVAHAIYGALSVDQGTITFAGQDMKGASIADHVQAGMALVPESRRDQGLMMHRSILENVTLPYLKKFSGLWGINKAQERAEVDQKCTATTVKHDGIDRTMQTLSGGNQQKVLFARAAVGQPKLLIADEPTRGVDVGAKRSIYERITGLAAQGEAILLISSETEEIMGLCHRVLVMSRGRIAAELEGEALTEDAVMQAAFSGG